MVGTGQRSPFMSHRADPRESRRTLQCTTPQPSRKGRKPMLNETIGAAFRSSATLVANDRVHLVPYCDQLSEDHLRLRMAFYLAITKFTTATTSDVAFYRKMQVEDKAVY